MAPYATIQDLLDRYGEDALAVAAGTDADTGELLTDPINKALKDATGEINMFVGERYDLPLPSVPDVLTLFCTHMAYYLLCADSGAYTEEARQRYEDAISRLERIASGKAALELDSDGDSEGEIEPGNGLQGQAHLSGPPRRFGRSKWRA